jgi:hypothetical protein
VLRKIYGWHVESIVDEYNAYAQPKARPSDVNFIQGLNHSALVTLHHQLGPNSRSKIALFNNASHMKMTRILLVAIVVMTLWSFTAIQLRI